MVRTLSLAIALAIAVSLAACASHDRALTAAASRAHPSAEAAHGPVVVTIVIDAFAAWEADERLGKLPADGGFARLRREGTYVRAMRYEHAALDTAPGHASLYTGATPRVSGIVANEILDEATGRARAILSDASTHIVGPGGVEAGVGSSAAALRSDTLADRLRAEHPRATILSLSIKDRGAILGGGHAPTASVWYDKEGDRFVTSTAFASELPAWARARARVTPGPAAAAIAKHAIWSPLDADWVRANARTPDAQPGEADLEGLGRTFPHDLSATRRRSSAFRATPFADEALLSLAVAALDAPRDPHEPLLLALSLSAHDYIGHVFGPDSWESWDELRRLDASLQAFFRALDVRFGDDGWAALVTGDHGATPMPEAARAHPRAWSSPGERLSGKELEAELKTAAREAGFAESAVVGISDPYVYLSPEARALPEPERERLEATLQRALLKHEAIARVLAVRALPSECPTFADQSIDALVCRSVAAGRGGDLFVVAAPGSFFATDLGDPTEGSAHGSPYLFDRTVPLLMRVRGVARAPASADVAAVDDGPLEFSTFARTAASLLGVTPPSPAAAAIDLNTRARARSL